ncbi:sugar phosphate isomerase/epimerase family protein [Streptomyces radicis]|uniref:Sugar phosphate isomerase/epimerase n=1 Tax=Streptomyces radicis TaxID=1750517 RepID=A0A3A9WE86_9ACTN|nr:sugar phosphate isomerase/epimerase family protein [Streptomyces radicis]RKN10623.1 sugar phosphate isomerase/epimerase [Streptomyces radicis]RKN24883.1 sugar phosphate isomerase/epimerase [Streptomyces radicis]
MRATRATRATRTFGVSTWVWTSPLTDQRLAELAPRVREWGFDVIELPVENVGDWDPHRAAKLLDALGLSATVVLAMAPGRELVAADRETITATRDYVRRVVDVASAVSSPVVAGPAYTSVGRTWRITEAERRACYEQLRDSLAPVFSHAADAGIRVAVEPLNRFETSLINTVDQVLDALAGLPTEGWGVGLDLFHMNIEERNIPAAIRRATGRIAHVQVAANDRGAPGAGHLDWPGIVAALDAAGYEGPLVIETFTGENETMATAASIWRPLAPSQDAIAVDGLSFLTDVTREGGGR